MNELKIRLFLRSFNILIFFRSNLNNKIIEKSFKGKTNKFFANE